MEYVQNLQRGKGILVSILGFFFYWRWLSCEVGLQNMWKNKNYQDCSFTNAQNVLKCNGNLVSKPGLDFIGYSILACNVP